MDVWKNKHFATGRYVRGRFAGVPLAVKYREWSQFQRQQDILVFLIYTFCASRQLTWIVECDCVFQVEQKSAGPVLRNARAPTRVFSILFCQLIFRDNSNLKTKIVVLFSMQISVEIRPNNNKIISWCPQCDDPYGPSGVHYFHLFSPWYLTFLP